MDILVLPSISTDDGWGVVVSEALMMGVAVIVSDKVGASVVFNEKNFWKSVYFKNYNSLRDKIMELNNEGMLHETCRDQRMRMAPCKAKRKIGAKYLSSILVYFF